MFDDLKIYGDRLLPLLQPGERPVAMLMMDYFPGEEHFGQPVEHGWSIEFDLMQGFHHHAWDHLPDRFISGVTLIAPGGQGLAVSLPPALSATVQVVLTSERMFVLHGIVQNEPLTITWQCRLSDIAFLGHDPRWPLARGRVAIGFVDGSAVRLIAGTIFAKRAKQLANAFAEVRRH